MTIGASTLDNREQSLLPSLHCRACGETVVWVHAAWRHGPGDQGYSQVCGCGRSWGGPPTIGRPEGGM